MEVKGGVLALGLKPGLFELLSEDGPHSLSFSLDSLGSVFNCCTDYFRKWVSGRNSNEVQPQREFSAGTKPKWGGLRRLEEVKIDILLQSM